MSVSMIVKKAFRPGGSNSPLLHPGNSFEASGHSQAKLYRALGWAQDAPVEVKLSEPKRETPPPVPAVPMKRTYTKRTATYQTRDMVAEGQRERALRSGAEELKPAEVKPSEDE